MKKEPKKIKLNPESPSSKDVKKIPMPSLVIENNTFGSVNENNSENNSKSIQQLESDETD